MRLRQLAGSVAMAALATFTITAAASASTVSTQTTEAGAAALFPGTAAVTFNSVAPGAFSTYTSQGVTFTPDSGTEYIDGTYANQFNTFGQSLHNCYCGNSFGQVTMTFATPVSGIGFFWGASDNQWTLSAYDSSNALIESFLLPITSFSNAGDFVGIKDPGIAYAILAGPSSDYVFIDDVTGIPGGVPEPATWAMMVAGLGLLGGALRTARRTTVNLVKA